MLLVIVGLCALLLFYCVKLTRTTPSECLPGLPPQFLVGNLLQAGLIWPGKPMCLVLQDFQRKFGDLFQFWVGSVRLIVVSGHEDVHHIFAHRHVYEQGGVFLDKYRLINPDALICLTGAKYKRHAAAIRFLFRRHRILRHQDVINECTEKLIGRWHGENRNPMHVRLDMIECSEQLLLDIFGFIAFDFDLQNLAGESKAPGNDLSQALLTYLRTSAFFVQLPSMTGQIYMLLNFRYRRAQRIIEEYLSRMIARETSIARNDHMRATLIGSMVDSLTTDEHLEAMQDNADQHGLSRAEITNEMLSLLGAGFGTTSTSLAWFIHLMSKHPQVQLKIKQELLPYDKQRLSVEQLDQLVYLECVLRELLRFAPPIIGALRRLTADDRLPASGVTLKKGDELFISIYNLERDARYCPGAVDPEQFYPERFLAGADPERGAKRPSVVFGGGHRQCIGQDLARFELKTICTRLMQFVTFGDGGETLNSGGYHQRETLMPKRVAVTLTFDC